MSKILFAQVTPTRFRRGEVSSAALPLRREQVATSLNWEGLKPSCAKNNKKNVVRIMRRDTQTNYTCSTIIEQIGVV